MEALKPGQIQLLRNAIATAEKAALDGITNTSPHTEMQIQEREQLAEGYRDLSQAFEAAQEVIILNVRL